MKVFFIQFYIYQLIEPLLLIIILISLSDIGFSHKLSIILTTVCYFYQTKPMLF